MNKGASYKIGVTQPIFYKNNWIYDSDNDNRSKTYLKILNDPVAMKKKQSIFKSNKEASSSSKSNVVKKTSF